MRIVEKAEVFEKLTMEKCIEVMHGAFIKLESGKCVQPPRTIHALDGVNMFGFMPAYLGKGDYFGAKVINACSANIGTKYPSHVGYVIIFEAEHGTVAGMVEAGSITQIRTGAVSAVATDLLARADADKLAIIGAGAQGRSHLEACMCVRNIKEVSVYDISDEAAKGQSEEDVVESLGGPRIIARTIVDAALDTDDRPDGFETFGSGPSFDEGQGSHGQRESGPSHSKQTDPHVHYVDFSKWYVRLIAGLVVLLVIFLIMTVFFGIMGLAGWILSYIWPILLVMMVVWMFRGPRR